MIDAGVPALTRGRLSHVDQHYRRPDTYALANAALIDPRPADISRAPAAHQDHP